MRHDQLKLALLPTPLARNIIKSVVSVRPFVVTLSLNKLTVGKGGRVL